MDSLGQVVWDHRTSNPVIFLGYGLGNDELDPRGVYIFKLDGKMEHVPYTPEYGPATQWFTRICEPDHKKLYLGTFCEQNGLQGKGNFGVLQWEIPGVREELLDTLRETNSRGVTKLSDDLCQLLT